LEILADEEALKRAVVKYGDAIAHMKKMYDHLKINYPDYNSEVEISVDETESVTTPFEHFFIASELNRLNVKIISLAPRFVGSFEKGIDYKGDLGLFRREYIKHVKIAAYFGNYKISLHSGSDKFTVYRIISSINTGYTHIKTAGTSYLEALKVAAIKEPDLFREILDYCRGLYDNEKYSYHVSADINKIQPAREYSDQVLVSLFMMDDLRQILHVTFGRVLTDRDNNGEFKFKKRLMDCLSRNEEVHYEVLRSHFRKHLEPFENQQGTK
jgi:tagaturonate epimerase